MVALYVTSWENGSGKTSICAGIGQYLKNSGKKIGFLKPVIANKAGAADGDAALIKHLLALDEADDLLSPTFKDEADLAKGIKGAIAKVSPGKDIVIIDGVNSRSVIEAAGVPVIAVETYSNDLSGIIESYKGFGPLLLGIIINKVPARRLDRVRAEASSAMESAGIKLLAVLPEDRTLIAMTVAELAALLQGELISGNGGSSGLVENLMIGALAIDPGPHYFSRKANKAALIKSGRSDMQLATLQTSTSCLVLTGSEKIQPVVLAQAREKNVPIILAGGEIPDVAATIETAIGKSGFNREKLTRLSQILEQHLDIEQVLNGLG